MWRFIADRIRAKKQSGLTWQEYSSKCAEAADLTRQVALLKAQLTRSSTIGRIEALVEQKLALEAIVSSMAMKLREHPGDAAIEALRQIEAVLQEGCSSDELLGKVKKILAGSYEEADRVAKALKPQEEGPRSAS